MDYILFCRELTLLLIDAGIKATIFLVLIGGTGWVLTRKKPAWAGLLGAATLAVLLGLPLASLQLPGWQLPLWPFTEEVPRSWAPSSESAALIDAEPSRDSFTGIGSPPALPPLGEKTSLPSWTIVVSGLYLSGLLFMLLRLGAGVWKTRTLRRETQLVPDLAILDRWREQLGIHTPVELGISWS